MSFGRDLSLDYGYDREEAVAAERAGFIRRTYGHLAGAILAFILIESLLLSIAPVTDFFLNLMVAGSIVPFLVVFLVFIVVGYLAESWARQAHAPRLAYAGLALYVVVEALIFVPIMLIATRFTADQTLIPFAGLLTLAVFGGLTLTVFITKKDFSFLGPILAICSFIAFAVILGAILFGGLSLGKFFMIAMIVLMAGYILYYTSNVLHHYDTNQHVAASLALFAAIATMFWYILRLLIYLSSVADG